MAESRPAVISGTAAPPLLLHAAERVRANAGLIGLPEPHDRGVAIA